MGSFKLLVVIVFALTVFCSLPSRTEADMNVFQVIQSTFPALYRYVSYFPDLVAALSNNASYFTVFAPSDLALNSSHLPYNNSLPILYHVASGVYRMQNLTFGSYIPTLLTTFAMGNNSQVLIVGGTNTSTTVNGVSVSLNQSHNATNGIVYGIDSVLMTPSNYVVDIVKNNYTTLNSLLSLSGLDLELHPVSLFAPTNAAFTRLPSYLTTYLGLNNSMSKADLQNILLYHAVGVTPVYTGQLARGASKEITTLSGADVSLLKPVTYPNSYVQVNGIDIVDPNVLAENGVVHGIDGVLVPSNFSFTLEKVLYGLGATSFLQQVMYHNLQNQLLNDSAPRTLFVPTNAAIGSMNLTSNDLLYHAVAGTLNETQLENAYLVNSLLTLSSLDNTAQVLKLTIQVNTTGTLLVNGIAVGSSPFTTMGTPVTSYVYLIGSVLSTPAYVPDVLASNHYRLLVAAVEAAKLPHLYNNSLTIFAPTDEAFDMLPPGVFGYLTNTNISNPDLLTSILFAHVVEDPTVYYSNNIPPGTTTLPTLSNGNPVSITKTSTNITVNGAAVVYPDIIAANGVIHGINRVLIPAGVTFSVQNVLEGLGNFSRLLNYLSETGLLSVLNNSTNLTLFAPDDEAFDNVADLDSWNTTRLTEVLKAHVVFRNISMLSANDSFPTAIDGQSIVVLNETEIELRNAAGETLGTPASIGAVTYSRNGYAYGITRVLGVEQATSSGGLKLWQKILIVVGSVVAGLLLLIIVAAVGFFIYNTYYKNKNGYRKIND